MLSDRLRWMVRSVRDQNAVARGYFSRLQWGDGQGGPVQPADDPLRAFFEGRREGPGIWKWQQYFDAYHRHFQRFRGLPVHVLEIGVYSGGSLDMWRDYFGPQAHIYGVDIEPDCLVYQREGTRIFIGDQEDRSFWSNVREAIPALDIVIDDGGHRPEQQIVTLEELLPFVRPGGVYLCEDIHRPRNEFMQYMCGLIHRLNDMAQVDRHEDNERRLVSACTPFQSAVGSIHLYPYLALIERNASPVSELVAPKHGSQWQPFLK